MHLSAIATSITEMNEVNSLSLILQRRSKRRLPPAKKSRAKAKKAQLSMSTLKKVDKDKALSIFADVFGDDFVKGGAPDGSIDSTN